MNLAEMLAMADQAAQNVELNDGEEFAPIDPGTYEVAVTAAEGPCESKKTDPSNPSVHGQYLNIELTITGPKLVGRKVWMNNNIICVPSDTSDEARTRAQKGMAIGGKERKVMLDSLGKTGIQAAAELVGATFTAVVVTEKGKNGYKDRSVVKSVKPLGSSPSQSTSAQPSAAPARPSSAPARPSSARAKMPWEK